MFLFKDGLSLIINRLSLNSSKNFAHGLLNMSHLKAKIKSQFFGRIQQGKREQRIVLCVTWTCVQVL